MSHFSLDPTATQRGRIVYDRPRRTWSLWLAAGGALSAVIALWPDDGDDAGVTAASTTRVAAVVAETPWNGAPAAAAAAPILGAAVRLLPSAQVHAADSATDDEVVIGQAGNDPFGARLAWSGGRNTPQSVQADEDARADAQLEAARARAAPHIAGEGVLGSPVVSLGIAAETVPTEVAANLSRVPHRGKPPDVGVLAQLQ
jgi:hypothetical protein